MQLRLRDALAKSFNEQKKTKTDIFTNHRALAKLFKEAGRLKNVLSANTGHMAQVKIIYQLSPFLNDAFSKLKLRFAGRGLAR